MVAAVAPRDEAGAAADAHMERLAFENGVRLWGLGVRFAARDLLSLGRPYEADFALSPGSRPVKELADLGLELVSIYGSHLLQVKGVTWSSMATASIVPKHGACKSSASTPLTAIQAQDFLVGVNTDDLLAEPMALNQVRKRILTACGASANAGARAGAQSVLTLRFVRLDRLVEVDATRQFSHGHVLNVLNGLERTQEYMKRSYDELLSRNREIVTQRLTRHKKLFAFVVRESQQLKERALQDERYQLAARFQVWYAGMMATSEYIDDESDDEDDGGAAAIEVSIDMVDDDDSMNRSVIQIEDSEEIADAPETSRSGMSPQYAAGAPPAAVSRAGPSSLETRLDRLSDLGAANVDFQWRDVLGSHDMKWLPNASVMMTKYIEGLADTFLMDGVWKPAIVTVSRSIAECLVRLYAKKLRTTPIDNATARKDFNKHARMIRSNVSLMGNKELRSDLLSGVISAAGLCEMTSEQLAPQALQADRQRRHEQHAKEITIVTPKGPTLVKTKHGVKEVYFGGLPSSQGSELFGDSQSPSHALDGQGQLQDVTTSDKVSELGNVTKERDTGGNAEEVTQRFHQAINLQSMSSKAIKQVSFQTDSEPCADHPSEVARSSKSIKPCDVERSLGRETWRFSTDDAKTFLRVLFDPSQDIVCTLQQLQATIQSIESLATMSREFVLADGVKLHRDLVATSSHHGTFQFHARVRLAHWIYESSGSNDREATMSVLYRLINEVEEFRRLFGGMLNDLRERFQLQEQSGNRRAHDEAFSYLVSKRIAMLADSHPVIRRDRGERIEEYDVHVTVDGMRLVTVRDCSTIVARNKAARELTVFLGDLILLVHDRSRLPDRRNQQERHDDIAHERWEQNRGDRNASSDPTSGFDTSGGSNNCLEGGVAITNDHSREDKRDLMASVDRKRPFTSTYGESEAVPSASRRKVEQNPERTRQRKDGPSFIVDSTGETKSALTDPTSHERQLKMSVDGYQELVKAVSRNRDDVHQRVRRIDWDARIPERKIEFSSRLSISQRILCRPDKRGYRCELKGLEGVVNVASDGSLLEEAANKTTDELLRLIDELFRDWDTLVKVYRQILRRKSTQRGKVADPTISAANETRKAKEVNRWVIDEEKPAGHLAEFVVRIRGFIAIRHACLNMKMAKRAASEEFRDLLEYLTRARNQRVQTPQLAERTQTKEPESRHHIFGNSRAAIVQLPRAPAVVPSPPPCHASYMVQCSDDSEDDDDDYGGGYSDDDDGWVPALKTEMTSSVSSGGSDDTTSRRDMRGRMELKLAEPYEVSSETARADDAKLRAVVRSLFTPADALCEGISALRGVLKYRGSFNTVDIVPNVKASIRLELLRHDVFNVHASVNEVIEFKATAISKHEACDKAIDGVLTELKEIRSTWAQLLHFFHIKELGNSNLLDSFNALRLANIASITTSIEKPPTMNSFMSQVDTKLAADVHCVLRVGGKVVQRIFGETEEDAHTLAMVRTAKFLVDLIDEGLDPEPMDIGTAMESNAVRLDRCDWSCVMQLHDFGDPEKRTEFKVDATWCIRSQVPSAAEFHLTVDSVLAQVSRHRMRDVEQTFLGPMNRERYFFRVEATFENGKFVNHIAEYGNKRQLRTFVLELDVSIELKMLLFPPGASVNSVHNLYWSSVIMPNECADRKAIYGVLLRKPLLIRQLPDPLSRLKMK